MKVREYRSEDCESVGKLFYDTIHSMNSCDYNEVQLNAWASKDIDIAKWDKQLSANYSVVVEEDNILVGFGDVDNTGYFDHLFTHKDYQGKGVATLIADKIEKFVYQMGTQIITTHVSITAKPFFEKRGYIVNKAQTVEIRGQLLNNFVMKKKLG